MLRFQYLEMLRTLYDQPFGVRLLIGGTVVFVLVVADVLAIAGGAGGLAGGARRRRLGSIPEWGFCGQ